MAERFFRIRRKSDGEFWDEAVRAWSPFFEATNYYDAESATEWAAYLGGCEIVEYEVKEVGVVK